MRFLLLGATAVARENLSPVRARTAGVCIGGVAASSLGRAQQFAEEMDCPQVFGSYEDGLASPDVDAVYISVHNSLHGPLACEAAELGKHVLVEKPASANASQLAAVLGAARASNVLVREAVLTRRQSWKSVLADWVASGRYGSFISSSTTLEFASDPAQSFRSDPSMGGGAFLDTASYWLDIVQGTTGLGPESGALGVPAIAARCLEAGPLGADLSAEASLAYANGARAELRCSLGKKYTAAHEVFFEEARVRVPNFLLPLVAPYPLNIHVETSAGRDVVRCAVEDPRSDQLLSFRLDAASGFCSRDAQLLAERVGVIDQALEMLGNRAAHKVS